MIRRYLPRRVRRSRQQDLRFGLAAHEAENPLIEQGAGEIRDRDAVLLRRGPSPSGSSQRS